MSKAEQAVRAVISKYATFQGRASRPEFWWWVLVYLIVMFLASMLDSTLFGWMDDDAQVITPLLSLALLLPNLAVGARRLHDSGRSGWWLLIGLIPVIGLLVLIYFYVQRSEPGPNRFGPPEPLPQSTPA
ncbi:DUF805 domain-containing protein [Marivita sp. GX14005]|uniref:DUF805 domain-containing protein n=1 Tax=Marivita sp. GX14005 TaxID=2942276 RepID=UPI002018DFE2|nr:DUF805 domain-containing protein [Marivita sp. GX14005]MCL3881147.1 DUF805 domain-containing protein [Marivita sp. GX14005]